MKDMHAYIIIGKDEELIKDKARSLAESHLAKLTPFNLDKIADVKELSKLTRLTLSKTAFFIEHVDEATTDALNAFLKQLEEPGENIIYILTARSEEKVLPTIVSRCQIVKVQRIVASSMSKFKIQSEGTNEFVKNTIGQQFIQLDKIKKREDAIVFMQELIEELHRQLLTSKDSNLSLVTCYLSQSQQTLTALLKNGNVTSQLTRFVVAVNRE